MNISDQEDKKILQVILDIGVAMTKCGAENSRVEDSLYRMCKSYGFARYDIFALPSNIQATIETFNGDIHTQIRHIENTSNDFYRLDYLNNLSRKACAETPCSEDLQLMLDEVLAKTCRIPAMRYFASMLGAAGFCVFFKGSLIDAAVAALVAILVTFIGDRVEQHESNTMIYNFIVSMIAEIAIILLVAMGIGDHAGRITTGIVMLVVSGLGITNGIRDLLHKDVVSGIINMTVAFLGAAGIAAGIALPIMLLRGVI